MPIDEGDLAPGARESSDFIIDECACGNFGEIIPGSRQGGKLIVFETLRANGGNASPRIWQTGEGITPRTPAL